MGRKAPDPARIARLPSGVRTPARPVRAASRSGGLACRAGLPSERPGRRVGRIGGGDGRRVVGTQAGGFSPPSVPAALPTVGSGGPPGRASPSIGTQTAEEPGRRAGPPGPPHGSGAMSEARRLAVASPRPGRLFRRPPRLGQSPDSRGGKTCARPTKPTSRRGPWSAMNPVIDPRACPPLARWPAFRGMSPRRSSAGGRHARTGRLKVPGRDRIRGPSSVMDAVRPRASIHPRGWEEARGPRLRQPSRSEVRPRPRPPSRVGARRAGGGWSSTRPLKAGGSTTRRTTAPLASRCPRRSGPGSHATCRSPPGRRPGRRPRGSSESRPRGPRGAGPPGDQRRAVTLRSAAIGIIAASGAKLATFAMSAPGLVWVHMANR